MLTISYENLDEVIVLISKLGNDLVCFIYRKKWPTFLPYALIFFSSHLCMNGVLLSPQDVLTDSTRIVISRLMGECGNESNVDKKIRLFYQMNSILPKQYQINTPHLVTDDYIDTILYKIHQNMQS